MTPTDDRRGAKSVARGSTDAPTSIAHGTPVWWKGELYVADAVERHGCNWRVVIVEASKFHGARSRAIFVPLNEVDIAE